jgi:hypothetical protein
VLSGVPGLHTACEPAGARGQAARPVARRNRYPARMREIVDAFWRAATYCLLPRVMLVSLAPLALATAVGFGVAWLYWEDAINGVREALDQWELLAPAADWLNSITGGTFRAVIGPLVVAAVSLPVLLVFSLLCVVALMGPVLVTLVARRRFPALQRRQGTPWWLATLMALAATGLTLLGLALSMPLWLLPPVALVLPPLLWGWLAYRVMSVDALADHADADERRSLMREHRVRLIGMGVITGYLGMAPSLVWLVFGTLALPMMPLLVPVFVWLYTLVFTFSTLWFTHYCLATLSAHRSRAVPDEPVVIDVGEQPAPALPLK